MIYDKGKPVIITQYGGTDDTIWVSRTDLPPNAYRVSYLDLTADGGYIEIRTELDYLHPRKG